MQEMMEDGGKDSWRTEVPAAGLGGGEEDADLSILLSFIQQTANQSSAPTGLTADQSQQDWGCVALPLVILLILIQAFQRQSSDVRGERTGLERGRGQM